MNPATKGMHMGSTAELDPQAREALEFLYKDLHTHPELSFAETRTAGKIAEQLTALGLRVIGGVGRTGVVGVLENGAGPVVLLRADIDALPVREQTGLPYASTATGTDPDGNEVPVMHACGHDMHIVCLLGALGILDRNKDTWSGTVVAVFQPAEEVGSGAQAMVDDGLYERVPKPDIVLAQHVGPFPAGTVAYRAGDTYSAADAWKVRLFGRGGHGSRPETTIDPVVMAAATVMRLQTVRSREVAGNEPAVVTVGSIRAGTKANIIPDEAELLLNIRSYDANTRTHILDAIRRIIEAEAAASGAPKDPEITVIDSFPVLHNDPDATAKTAAALRDALGDKVFELPTPVMASEDAGTLATAIDVPIVYWFFGGADPAAFAEAFAKGRVAQDIPSNHSPNFAPLIQPTLDTGCVAMATAALAWLG
ncbi:amidohydrolase [Nocardia arthritidis]|uniref:Amidohydrolase n=2 Tax=Nocardia arthritidis TaxID=228602 RepID=A0A6G9YMU6_9NOCA|nr:amidohydrolase [Nocardia arthritidis]